MCRRPVHFQFMVRLKTKIWGGAEWPIFGFFNLRLKPNPAKVEGAELPKPAQAPLNENEPYFFPDLRLSLGRFKAEKTVWQNSDIDMELLKGGFVHVSHENAQNWVKWLNEQFWQHGA